MSGKKYRIEKDCLNCGQEVLGRFCHNCGQENVEMRDNFFHLTGHFISDYLHFDSKFFRSLIPLFTKPGFLTKQYWEGKRVSYIPPLRLFFFVTIVFMISTSYFYSQFGTKMKDGMIRRDQVLAQYDSAEIAALPDTAKVHIRSWERTVTAEQMREMLERDQRQFRKLQAGVDFVFRNLKYVTFFLLPVYALIFKVLNRKIRPYYIDHLTYAMHLQTFVYIVLMVLFGVSGLFPSFVEILQRILFAILFVYVLISLYYLYRQRWWKTLLKSLTATFLLIFITIVTIIGVTAIDAIFFQ